MAVSFGGLWLLRSGTADDHPRDRRSVCDKAIDAVMTSRDVVAVERGGVLIRELGCDVARRIRPSPEGEAGRDGGRRLAASP
jgi:hypothetical protein